MVRGWYPPEIDSTVLNTDWFLRRAFPAVIRAVASPVLTLWNSVISGGKQVILKALDAGEQTSRKSGLVSGVASTGAAASIFLAIFALMLLLRFIA
jgi:hypothetical protein